MDQVLIEQIITRGVATVSPDCSIEEAISLMREKRISCVVVAEERETLGVITERDIVRLFNQFPQQGSSPKLASDAMSSPW